MIEKLIPHRLKNRIKRGIQLVADEQIGSWDLSNYAHYLPFSRGSKNFVISKKHPSDVARGEGALPVPPIELWLGYGATEAEYLGSGKKDTETMKYLLGQTEFAIQPGQRILDLGCGGGRMIRHLHGLAAECEVWGLDISSECIYWCQKFLKPLRFATNTTNPHLPFEDQFFDLIYCGSLFTHIDDLAPAWLLEIRRVLRTDGRVYLTIHDNETVSSLDGSFSEHWLAKGMNRRSEYRQNKTDFTLMVMGRGRGSQVFYDREYFTQLAENCMKVRSFTPNAYAYQTAVVLSR